ncbi:MAG: DUF1700 domain-containing protein, partial [Lachnospiraceae bacterium]
TRQNFLKQLKKELRFKHGRDEISSILSDYNEFFDIELGQGKSEIEVCATLGHPHSIAQSLNQQMNIQNNISKILFSRNAILLIVFLTAICMIFANITDKVNQSYNASTLIYLLIYFPVITLISWIAITKTPFNFNYSIISKKSYLYVAIIHIFIFLSSLLLFFFMYSVVIHNEYFAKNFIPSQVGTIVRSILNLSICVMFTFVITGIYYSISKSFIYYSVFCHALGGIIIVLYYTTVLHSLSDISTYSLRIMQSCLIYFESILVSAIFIFLARKKELHS